jgi:curli biogenesis system outer membrane secretion channel CsgG
MKFHLNLAFRGVIGILNIFVISTPNIVFSGTKDFSENEPVVIAVRKFKNFAGDFAENGVIEGSNGEKVRVGFWKPSYEIKLAEVLTTELANTGHFNIVERNNLYEVYNEQSISGIQNNIKKANYIIIASLSDYIPNTAGSRSNSDGRVLIFRTGRDRTEVDTYVAVDVRVINTSTGGIALSRTIEGTTSSVAKADRSGLALGLIDTTSEKQSYETTSATRALRAALIKVVDYLDCQLYLKNECIAKYEAEDQKRKNSTEGTLNLF